MLGTDSDAVSSSFKSSKTGALKVLVLEASLTPNCWPHLEQKLGLTREYSILNPQL